MARSFLINRKGNQKIAIDHCFEAEVRLKFSAANYKPDKPLPTGGLDIRSIPKTTKPLKTRCFSLWRGQDSLPMTTWNQFLR
jgi:hypothetical protein